MDYHLHAGMNEEDYADFIGAVTAEFSGALAEVVQVVPQDCFDPLLEVYGLEFNPVRLSETTAAQIAELRETFAEELENDAITEDHIRLAVSRSQARWPA
ncbi:MAG: hypothetical protein AMXMBFR33_18500 [Candidatus Xenobia bacterium]